MTLSRVAITVCALFALPHLSEAQTIPRGAQIVAAEYFVGADPGPGAGTPISLNSPSMTTTVFIEHLNLQPGTAVHVRFKDANGYWSATRSFRFTGAGINRNATIAYAEYFKDADPGPGSGVSIPVQNAASAGLSVESLSLQKGELLSLRVRDSQKRWSFPLRFRWTGVAENRATPIRYVEYFIDTDPGQGHGVELEVKQDTTLALSLPSLNLSPGQSLYFRVKDADNRWSAPASLRYQPALIRTAEIVVGKDPSSTPFGGGILMVPLDGHYDSPVETVQGTVIQWSPEDTIWVRAQSSEFLWSRPVGTARQAPSAPRLLEPADGDTIEIASDPRPIEFRWTASQDPNPQDTLTYSLSLRGPRIDTTLAGLQTTSVSLDIMPLLQPGSDYRWTAGVTDGVFTVPSPDTFSFHAALATAVGEESSQLPRRFSLWQNYPNPFNPSTTIHYELPEEVKVRLTVYDVRGRELAELVNRKKRAGRYDVTWNAKGLPSGVYFYRLHAGDFVETRRMLLLK